MLKIKLWGEPKEIEAMIERLCNQTPDMRVLSVSKSYQDRGASVYERVYLDVALHESVTAATAETCKSKQLELKASKKIK